MTTVLQYHKFNVTVLFSLSTFGQGISLVLILEFENSMGTSTRSDSQRARKFGSALYTVMKPLLSLSSHTRLCFLFYSY